MVLVWLRPFLVRFPDGTAGAGLAGLRVRLVRLSLPRDWCLSFDHYPSHDLCLDAGFLSQRDGFRWQ
ncbi:hypothetical protein D3C87_2094510 [compost metagenome]